MPDETQNALNIAALEERSKTQGEDIKEIKADVKSLIQTVNTLSTERRIVGMFGGFVGAIITYFTMSLFPLNKK